MQLMNPMCAAAVFQPVNIHILAILVYLSGHVVLSEIMK